MSTVIVSEGTSDDASVKNQTDDNESRFKWNLDPILRMTTSHPVMENQASILEAERKLSASPPPPPPPPQNQPSESKQESEDIKEVRQDKQERISFMAVPFRYVTSETQEMTSRTIQSSRSHIATSTHRTVENNLHENSQSEEVGIIPTSLIFHPPSHERNDDEYNIERMTNRFHVEEGVRRMSARPSGSTGVTSQASRENAPPRTALRLRRLSLPDPTATTNHHHVHEHHHHVWNHYAPGAGGPPAWPPQPWQPYQPWSHWHQQRHTTRCPTCGRGSRSPVLAQFPWAQRGGKLSVLGGLLFLLAMGMCRSIRLLRLAHAPAPPAIQ